MTSTAKSSAEAVGSAHVPPSPQPLSSSPAHPRTSAALPGLPSSTPVKLIPTTHPHPSLTTVLVEAGPDADDTSSLETDTSILLGVQALERQAQRKQNEIEALGVQALERQQAEVEARRKRTNSLSKSLTAPPSSSMPPVHTAAVVSRGTPMPPLRMTPHPMYHPSGGPYPPTVVLGGRDPTVTTAASGSEGDGSNSFGHGSGNESWYINRDYQATKEEDSEDGQMKRSGSVGRFLRNYKQFLKTGYMGDGGAFPNEEEDEPGTRNRIPTSTVYSHPTSGGTTSYPHTSTGNNIPRTMDTTTSSSRIPTTDGKSHPPRVAPPLLYGYLHKRGRNGQWQRRWFEIDGKSLTYFKSKKHTSESDVLATLDLSRVGQIQMDESDPEGCTFTIHVAKRNYYLHAETRDRAMDWVINLNRVREARLSIGGLTLLDPSNTSPSRVSSRPPSRSRGNATSSDEEPIRYPTSEEAYASRVKLVSGRERTKGYGKQDLNDDLKSFFVQPTLQQSMVGMEVGSGMGGGKGSPTSSPKITYTIPPATTRPGYPPMPFLLPPVPEEMETLGRWEKRRSKIQNWTRRLSRWARRMTMIRCVIKDDVVPFAHCPPGSFPPPVSYMQYDPRYYPHAPLPYDYYSDAQHTGRSLGQISEGEVGSHSKATSANDDHDSVQNPPSVGSGEGVFTGYEKYKHRMMDDASNQSTRLSSGRGSPMVEEGVV